MTPSPSPFPCGCGPDEWCDVCFPVEHAGILAALDREADALPSLVPCQNGRHDHQLATGPRCWPLVPQDRPVPDRVAGTVLIVALTGLGAAVVGGWAVGTWLATTGRLHAAAAAQRAANAWQVTR